MMNDATYFLIVKIIANLYWRGTLLHPENLPVKGPAVLIANHLGPMGPIGTICSIRLRLYPWVIANMVDQELAPDYLRVDFVEPFLMLKSPLSLVVAKAISHISAPLLTNLGYIAANRGNYDDLQDTLQVSLELLKQGKIVLVFPEEPHMEVDPETNMRPILKGFTRLGELYFEETGETLSFYPIAVHELKTIMVASLFISIPIIPTDWKDTA